MNQSSTSHGEPRGLERWGWNDERERWWRACDASTRARLEPARVVKELRGVLEVRTEGGELDTRIPGRFYQRGADDSAIPTVGDWVLVPRERPPGDCWIEEVLPRRSKFSRKVAGLQTREQVVAANIDDLFIVMGLDADFNPRRLERFLAAAHESGAEPVVVLNKADLADDLESAHESVRRIAGSASIYVVSSKIDLADRLEAVSISGFDELKERLRPGRTIAFVGSSGVGKSTLVNRLVGKEVMKVRKVRERDARGQHTTSHRELVRLPNGSLLIDNPGVREMQGWLVDDGLDETFDEIREIATRCRFRDCSHHREPGCAVRAALDAGEIDPERLASFLKLEREAREQAERRADRERQQETLAARSARTRRRGGRESRRR